MSCGVKGLAVPGEKYDLYPLVPASTLVLGDVLIESCTVWGHDCEGVHERLVGALVPDHQVRDLCGMTSAYPENLVLAITQDDEGRLFVDVMPGNRKLRVLRPRPKKPMQPLWALTQLIGGDDFGGCGTGP
jgi:hypothetical protein